MARKSTSWARRTSRFGAKQPGATTTIPVTTTGSRVPIITNTTIIIVEIRILLEAF